MIFQRLGPNENHNDPMAGFNDEDKLIRQVVDQYRAITGRFLFSDVAETIVSTLDAAPKKSPLLTALLRGMYGVYHRTADDLLVDAVADILCGVRAA
uniref:Uncharacterized protein n=1 Tax=Marseillevirus LCMAC103 TaxID=2506604 RepID=A0A481YW54_9VIRU|nr:MAG: hypothetical protein LCMAC103_03390 [Marseillevirus LCMAC103]